MPMTVVERMALSPVNFDSLTKLTTSGALQRVFKGIKDPEGLTELIGAARGGMIASRKKGGPIVPTRPHTMGQQKHGKIGF
jgi:hypothetical protein